LSDSATADVGRATSTYVSNWDDVRATVAASPYAYLLDRPEEQGA
jgi:hypothetical protein